MEAARSPENGAHSQGSPTGSQTCFLLLQNGPVFPEVCCSGSLGAGAGPGNGEREAAPTRVPRQLQREGEPSLSFRRHLLPAY